MHGLTESPRRAWETQMSQSLSPNHKSSKTAGEIWATCENNFHAAQCAFSFPLSLVKHNLNFPRTLEMHIFMCMPSSILACHDALHQTKSFLGSWKCTYSCACHHLHWHALHQTNVRIRLQRLNLSRKFNLFAKLKIFIEFSNWAGYNQQGF